MAKKSKPKILFIDIETAPNMAYVWGLWKQNVALNQIVDSQRMLCWAAKWEGSKRMLYYAADWESTEQQMLQELWELLDEADIVVHYNGRRFDMPHINREFVTHGITPPSPYKQIDLLTTVRTQFKFPSNKLQYVCEALGLGSKEEHDGFSLWVACMDGDSRAWRKMAKYNKQDVRLTEALYHELLPWIKNHPSRGLYGSAEHSCPNCGSDDLQRRGFARTAACMYQRYQCNSCGAWSRSRKRDEATPETLTSAG